MSAAATDAPMPNAWTVETLGAVVDAEVASLPKNMQAAFLRLGSGLKRLASSGLVLRMSSTLMASFGRCD